MFNLTESEVNELAKKNSFNRNMTEKSPSIYCSPYSNLLSTHYLKFEQTCRFRIFFTLTELVKESEIIIELFSFISPKYISDHPFLP